MHQFPNPGIVWWTGCFPALSWPPSPALGVERGCFYRMHYTSRTQESSREPHESDEPFPIHTSFSLQVHRNWCENFECSCSMTASVAHLVTFFSFCTLSEHQDCDGNISWQLCCLHKHFLPRNKNTLLTHLVHGEVQWSNSSLRSNCMNLSASEKFPWLYT